MTDTCVPNILYYILTFLALPKFFCKKKKSRIKNNIIELIYKHTYFFKCKNIELNSISH